MTEKDRASVDADYVALRYLTLGLTFEPGEAAVLSRTRSSLASSLGLGRLASSRLATECLLYHRERVLHEVLALDLPATRIPAVLDSVSAIGEEALRSLDPRRGTLLVSLHYGMYSSLLIWWLARAAAQGAFQRLTVLMRATTTGQYRLAESRTAEFEEAGVWDRNRVTLFDRDSSQGTVQDLVSRCGPGEAVLFFPDAELLPPDGRRLRLPIGNAEVGLRSGLLHVATETGATLVPLFIRPHRSMAHAVIFGHASAQTQPSASHEIVQSTLAFLSHQTLLTDPAPWEGWLRSRFPVHSR